jgi:hypothetical protein
VAVAIQILDRNADIEDAESDLPSVKGSRVVPQKRSARRDHHFGFAIPVDIAYGGSANLTASGRSRVKQSEFPRFMHFSERWLEVTVTTTRAGRRLSGGEGPWRSVGQDRSGRHSSHEFPK